MKSTFLPLSASCCPVVLTHSQSNGPRTKSNYRTEIPMNPTPVGSTSAADVPATATAAFGGDLSSTAVSRWTFAISQRYQHLLDKSTPHVFHRWIAFGCIAFLYAVRVYLLEGFYVVSYALGIYILNLLIGFLSPQVDPEFSGGPTLPTRGSDEFRPFVRRLPEFKFWYSITKAFCIAFVLTFFSIFDVPVFWPILLFYWIILCMMTLRRQIEHMIKYKYVPFSFGKQRYDGKRTPSSESESLLP